MRNTFRKCRPNTITTRPEALANSSWFCSTKAPKAEAVKPSSRNTVDSPSTKNSADRVALRRACA